ncbi:MAG: AraC family transcriptional regulator [Pseudomonadota bacterium]
MVTDYEARMLRVLAYIHENPAGDLSLDTLAGVAAMSRFHWHRVFRGMTGETCAQAARRIRLHRAACWLVQTEWSLAEVAGRCGYPTTQSFSRAFREGYGASPGRFRQRGELRPPLLRSHPGENIMFDVKIEDRPSYRLAAMAHEGPYPEIGKIFEQVSAIIGARGLWPHARGMMGVYYDDPAAVPAAQLRSHAGVLLDDAAVIAAPLEEIRTDAGEWAILTFKGPYAGLQAAYDYLWGKWLAESGREPRDAPAVENYLNSPAKVRPDDLLTEICLPLK